MARPGRRERLKMKVKRLPSLDRQAQVKANLSSIDAPPTQQQQASGHRDTLKLNTHTRGFNAPNGSLGKLRLERPVIAGHRFVFRTPDGQTWGGCDRQSDVKQALERFKLFGRDSRSVDFSLIEVVDTHEP